MDLFTSDERFEREKINLKKSPIPNMQTSAQKDQTERMLIPAIYRVNSGRYGVAKQF